MLSAGAVVFRFLATILIFASAMLIEVNSAEAQSPPLGVADRFLGGVWLCRTNTGADVRHLFMRGESPDIMTADTLVGLLNGHPERYRESFHKRGPWVDADLAAETVTATGPVWRSSSQPWVLTGYVGAGADRVGLRVVITLDGANVFRRDFYRNGSASSLASETCHRSLALDSIDQR